MISRFQKKKRKKMHLINSRGIPRTNGHIHWLLAAALQVQGLM